jgi:homoserine kinase
MVLAFSCHNQGYHCSSNSAARDGGTRSASLSSRQTQPLASVISAYESKLYEGPMLGSQAFITQMYRQLSHSGTLKLRRQHRSAKSMGFCLSGSSVRLIFVLPKTRSDHMVASNSWRSTSSHKTLKEVSYRSPSCH